MTWFALFLCFLALISLAPLLNVIPGEMAQAKVQVGWYIIGSVTITVIARLFIGWFCSLRETTPKYVKGSFLAACSDPRVWSLSVIYAACFGVELTFYNVVAFQALDYFNNFESITTLTVILAAGLLAGLLGLVNFVARTMGAAIGNRFGEKWGLKGRIHWLFLVLFCEGLALMTISQMDALLLLAIPTLILFSLFTRMAEAATFSIVPFVNRSAFGSISRILRAAGCAGAIAAGFLFQTTAVTGPTALLILGALVTCSAFLAFTVRFSLEAETEAQHEAVEATIRRRNELLGTAA